MLVHIGLYSFMYLHNFFFFFSPTCSGLNTRYTRECSSEQNIPTTASLTTICHDHIPRHQQRTEPSYIHLSPYTNIITCNHSSAAAGSTTNPGPDALYPVSRAIIYLDDVRALHSARIPLVGFTRGAHPPIDNNC